MYDPFGLSQLTGVAPPTAAPGRSPKKLLWVIGVMIGVILVLVATVFLALRLKISADVEGGNFSSQIKITGLPEEVKSSEQFSATISVTNLGTPTVKSGYLVVQGDGLNLAETLSLSKNLSANESGYLRSLNSEEKSLFEQQGDSGFYWYLGDLGHGQTKSSQVKATVLATGNAQVKIEAKYFKGSASGTVSCGFLGLSECPQTTATNQVGYGAETIKLGDQSKIKLRAGYNFISLPYVFTTSAAKTFLNSLGSKWAYYFDPSSGGYVDLNSADNASKIKPGVGFWVKSNSEGEYSLPSPKVETNISESFSIPLAIGWNHIGNPYPKRIIWSANDIVIHELGDDGRETGVVYSVKSAIDNQIISQAYIVSYKDFTDSSGTVTDLASLFEFKALPLNSYLNSSVGVEIQSTKRLNLVLPGQAIIAPGDLLSATEKTKIEEWIIKNGLNQFGDPADTAYSSGTPLVSTSGAAPTDRYDYIVLKHPDRPWNK